LSASAAGPMSARSVLDFPESKVGTTLKTSVRSEELCERSASAEAFLFSSVSANARSLIVDSMLRSVA